MLRSTPGFFESAQVSASSCVTDEEMPRAEFLRE
jgi:hypothetical protein